MLETSARLLRLLSLLQMHRDWSGGDLAERLGVSTRTVRRDVDRLRELGYPVDAVQGAAGYRLAAGSTLPPLLLDDEEALAVAVGLRTTTGGTVAGFEDSALRALTKLEQVMPSRLRHRLQALQGSLIRVEATAPRVEPDTLIAISDACHRHERLRFEYTNFQGRQSIKDVEPHSVVNFSRRWYLVAWDTATADWRSYRVDRLHPRRPAGPRFRPARHRKAMSSPISHISSPLARGPTVPPSPCIAQPPNSPTASGRAWACWRQSTTPVACSI